MVQALKQLQNLYGMYVYFKFFPLQTRKDGMAMSAPLFQHLHF